MLKDEYWGLVKALNMIEVEQERLEEENQNAIEDESAEHAATLFQQIIAVNALQQKVQTAVIEACG